MIFVTRFVTWNTNLSVWKKCTQSTKDSGNLSGCYCTTGKLSALRWCKSLIWMFKDICLIWWCGSDSGSNGDNLGQNLTQDSEMSKKNNKLFDLSTFVSTWGHLPLVFQPFPNRCWDGTQQGVFVFLFNNHDFLLRYRALICLSCLWRGDRTSRVVEIHFLEVNETKSLLFPHHPVEMRKIEMRVWGGELLTSSETLEYYQKNRFVRKPIQSCHSD